MGGVAVEILRQLVAVPSLNPQGRGVAEAGPLYGEERVARVVGEMCRSLPGVQVEWQEVAPGRPNVLVRLRPPTPAPPPAGPGGRPVLLFCTHLDTVGLPPGGEGLLAPRVEGGRLVGRGACDAKGSAAAMLMAVHALAQRGSAGPGAARLPRDGRVGGGEPWEVLFAFVADEEYGALGMRALVARGEAVAAAVLGEPTSLAVVVAHRGGAKWRLHTLGRSAHTSRAEAGVNAIYAMARVLAVVEAELPAYLAQALPAHPLCGPSAVHATLIAGGRDPNTVPDRCTVGLNGRLAPGVDVAAAVAQINRFLAGRVGDLGGATLEAEPPYFTLPGLDTPPQHPFVRAVQEAVRRAGGRGTVEGRPYGTDAPFVANPGVPVVVLGPGSEAQAHADDEWVELAEVERAAVVYAELAAAALEGRLAL